MTLNIRPFLWTLIVLSTVVTVTQWRRIATRPKCMIEFRSIEIDPKKK